MECGSPKKDQLTIPKWYNIRFVIYIVFFRPPLLAPSAILAIHIFVKDFMTILKIGFFVSYALSCKGQRNSFKK